MDALGDRIRKSREAAGFTQRQLASELEVNPATVSLWESGRNEPDIETVNRIADILGAPAAYLFTGREVAPPPQPVGPSGGAHSPGPPGDDDPWGRRFDDLRVEVSRALTILDRMSKIVEDQQPRRVDDAQGRNASSHGGGDDAATRDREEA